MVSPRLAFEQDIPAVQCVGRKRVEERPTVNKLSVVRTTSFLQYCWFCDGFPGVVVEAGVGRHVVGEWKLARFVAHAILTKITKNLSLCKVKCFCLNGVCLTAKITQYLTKLNDGNCCWEFTMMLNFTFE